MWALAYAGSSALLASAEDLGVSGCSFSSPHVRDLFLRTSSALRQDSSPSTLDEIAIAAYRIAEHCDLPGGASHGCGGTMLTAPQVVVCASRGDLAMALDLVRDIVETLEEVVAGE